MTNYELFNNEKINNEQCSIWKLGFRISFAILVSLFVIGIVNGCGERTESSSFYYAPSFTNSGKVIFTGGIENVRKDFLGGQLSSSFSEYVATMYDTGTGESSSIFSVDSTPSAMSCSPTRDYVAYMDDLRSGAYGKIVIRNISTEAQTGLQTLELYFTPRIKSFDWSNDGNKIVYCTSNEVRTRDWNDFNRTTDTLITTEANLEFVSWMYGSRIAFVYTSGGYKLLSLINPTSKAQTDLVASDSVDKPQISKVDNNKIYGIAGGSYVCVDVSGAPVSSEVKADFSGELPRLSPDATKVVYSKSGESTGIYVMTVSNGEQTKIK